MGMRAEVLENGVHLLFVACVLGHWLLLLLLLLGLLATGAGAAAVAVAIAFTVLVRLLGVCVLAVHPVHRTRNETTAASEPPRNHMMMLLLPKHAAAAPRSRGPQFVALFTGGRQ